jgi:ABC-2 type transport system ATP-binding protein
MAEDALWARDVQKRYERRGVQPVDALRGVSLSIRPGERVGLLGRNGAGKTTFLRIASTLLWPTSGEVRIFGHDIVNHPEEGRPLIAVVPQDGKPFMHLTPYEQVYTYLRTRGFDRVTSKQRTTEVLGQMGLTEVADRLNLALSGGLRQRVMVATVIATEAPLLFLDEPTIGMDPFARREVWQCLRRLSRKGSTLLLTTHYLDEAEQLSDRLYIIDRGRVLVEGSPEGLKAQIGGTIRVSLKGGMRLTETLSTFGTVATDGLDVHVILGPDRVEEVLQLALREKLSATVGPVSLEEAFLRVVGRSIDDES